MPLNLDPRSNADFVPYIKFNGKAGRWYTRNGDGEEVEVINPTALYDLANIKTGWIKFEEGIPPDCVWDEGGVKAPRPSEKHKRGFSVPVLSPKNIYGLRELSSTSNGLCGAMVKLYAQYEDALQSDQGKVPVVQCVNVVPVKSKFGTNYEPDLKIISWVDRPAALPNPEPVQAAATKDGLAQIIDDEIPDFDDPDPNPKPKPEW